MTAGGFCHDRQNSSNDFTIARSTQAEVQPIVALVEHLGDLKQNGVGALDAYVRNVRLKLFSEAKTIAEPFRGKPKRFFF